MMPAVLLTAGSGVSLVAPVSLHGGVSFTVGKLAFAAGSPGVSVEWLVGWNGAGYHKSFPGVRFEHQEPEVIHDGIHRTVPLPRLPPPRASDRLDVSWLMLVIAPVAFRLGLRTIRAVRPKVNAGHCAKCGYDLRATPARCPECGVPAPGAIR